MKWRDRKDKPLSTALRINSLLCDGSVEALWLWLKMAMQIVGNVEPEWGKAKDGRNHEL